MEEGGHDELQEAECTHNGHSKGLEPLVRVLVGHAHLHPFTDAFELFGEAGEERGVVAPVPRQPEIITTSQKLFCTVYCFLTYPVSWWLRPKNSAKATPTASMRNQRLLSM